MILRGKLMTAKRQAGFSIIELMIALVLGLVLIGGALQVFISSKRAYNLNEELAWVQDNARFAVGFLAEDIRMAGYYGCASRAGSVANVLNDSDSSWVTDFGKGIFGYDGDDAGFVASTGFPLVNTATLSGLPNSDAFAVHRSDFDNSFQVTGHNTKSAVIDIEGNHPYPNGTVLIVSDCHHSAVFQTTGNQSNKANHNTGNAASPGNCTKGLGVPVTCSTLGVGYAYKDDAFLMRAIGHAYYIDEASNGVPSLYKKSLDTGGITTTAEEMVQGVENMQLQYGVDSNGDSIPDRYLDASDVGTDQWDNNVTSVRITMLLRSQTELASEPQTITYMGTAYTPTDKYVRRVFSTTIKLRNRGV